MAQHSDLQKQVLELFEQLNIKDEVKRVNLLKVITGKSLFEALTETDYHVLIELLTDLLSKSEEEQELSLNLLLDASRD